MNPCPRQHPSLSRHAPHPRGATDHRCPGRRSLAGSSAGTWPPRPRALWVDGYRSGFIHSSDATEHLRRARQFRRPGVERTPRRKSRLRGVRGAVGDMDDKREQTKCTACWMTAHAKEKHRAGAEQGVRGPAPKPLDEGSRRFASHRGGPGRPPQMGRLSRRDGSEAAGGPGRADAGAPPPRGSARKPMLQGQNGPGGRARKSGRQSGRGSGVGPGRSRKDLDFAE